MIDRVQPRMNEDFQQRLEALEKDLAQFRRIVLSFLELSQQPARVLGAMPPPGVRPQIGEVFPDTLDKA